MRVGMIYADPELRWESGEQQNPTGWPTERGRLRRMREDEREYFSQPSQLRLPEYGTLG